MDKQMDVRKTYGISPHSTGLYPLLGLLPKKLAKQDQIIFVAFSVTFGLLDEVMDG